MIQCNGKIFQTVGSKHNRFGCLGLDGARWSVSVNRDGNFCICCTLAGHFQGRTGQRNLLVRRTEDMDFGSSERCAAGVVPVNGVNEFVPLV